MDNYDAGNSPEREHLIGATDPVLDSLDVLFNFWYDCSWNCHVVHESVRMSQIEGGHVACI